MRNRLRRISGVYEICHIATGNRYVGSSVDIECRLREHFRNLRRGRHQNERLQAAWQQFGQGAFVATVLCLVDNVSALQSFEQLEIDKGATYNISKRADRAGVSRRAQAEAAA